MWGKMKSLDLAWTRSLFPAAMRGEGASVRSRAFVMAIVLLLHVAALVALFGSRSVYAARRPPPSLPITLTLPDAVSDAGGSAAAETAPVAPEPAGKPLPMPILPEALPVPYPMPLPSVQAEPIDFVTMTPQFDAEPDPASTGDVMVPVSGSGIGQGISGDCALGAAVRQALEQNVEARTALARIPRQSRSVANAILLWNGEWVAAERVGGPPAIGAIQRAITEAIGNAPQHCQSQIEPGPVFLIVDSASETIVLALGSGAWRWTELLPKQTATTDPAVGNKR